ASRSSAIGAIPRPLFGVLIRVTHGECRNRDRPLFWWRAAVQAVAPRVRHTPSLPVLHWRDDAR
ncbi:MAG: hypothetical protein WBE93_13895, partial [Pseudolabrys sp.]